MSSVKWRPLCPGEDELKLQWVHPCLFFFQLVLLPGLSEMFVYTNGTTEAQAAMDACYVAAEGVDLALRANLTCAPFEYSVMAELYNGALGWFLINNIILYYDAS